MTINGRPVEIPAGHETAVEVLREGLDLTGTKLVCGTGVCGACTISVGGVPVNSCLLVAEDLEGADVVTIEGVAEGDDLHPVQAAFLHHDALQCGYCTPGFVVEAVAFMDRWREVSGITRPARTDIARALAGHLCRCGAYEGIYRAVADACAGVFETPATAMSPRPDGREKVTGQARYTTDIHTDAAVGRLIRADVPHGTLLDIDPHVAVGLQGVVAFVRLAEPGQRIRYRGQPLAAVAAVDEATARRAAAQVEVAVRPLPAAVGLRQCLSEEAPDVVGWWIPPSNNEAPALPNLRRGNLMGPTLPGRLNPWTVRRRLRKAATQGRAVDGEWETAVVSHTAFEPHAAVAEWHTDGSLVLYVSTQGVYPNQVELAGELGLAEEQVEVVARYVGGAFGAKQSLGLEAVAAARLAEVAGQPVRVIFDRLEELAVGGNRPGASIQLSASISSDGDLDALRIRSVGDGGASAGSLVASFLPRLLYPGAPRTLLDFDAVSNAPPASPFRAPGGPPALFALEAAIDELAERIGADPVVLRRSWNDRPLRGAMYDWVEAHPLWRNRRHPSKGRYRTGIGVAFGSWFQGHNVRVEVTVETGPDGITVVAGTQDMGNGTRAMLVSAVAEAFSVSPALVRVRVGRSSLGRGPMSSASRTTASLWPATRVAAHEARRRVLEQLPGLGIRGATPAPGGVLHAGEHLAWEELLRGLEPVKVTAGRPPDRHRLFPFPHHFGGLQFGRGMTEAAHVVEVEVDALLGRVRVVRVDSALAAGRIHSPPMARSQAFGGVIQGLGMAFHEERRIDRPTGTVLTTNLEDYRLLGLGDTPEMEVEFVEWGFEHVMGGGVGLAELSLVAVPAAAASAVAHAMGGRFRRLPIRPADIVRMAS
jgi:xanthine dehydrogenase YagR molybdenum-binding subunit